MIPCDGSDIFDTGQIPGQIPLLPCVSACLEWHRLWFAKGRYHTLGISIAALSAGLTPMLDASSPIKRLDHTKYAISERWAHRTAQTMAAGCSGGIFPPTAKGMGLPSPLRTCLLGQSVWRQVPPFRPYRGYILGLGPACYGMGKFVVGSVSRPGAIGVLLYLLNPLLFSSPLCQSPSNNSSTLWMLRVARTGPGRTNQNRTNARVPGLVGAGRVVSGSFQGVFLEYHHIARLQKLTRGAG